MKWWKYIAAAAVIMGMMYGPFMRLPQDAGTITSIRDVPDTPIPTKEATVQTSTGELVAQYYESEITFAVGDVVLTETTEGTATLTDFYRTPALLRLFGVFLVVVLLVTDIGGLRSLAGLAASFAIIMSFILPQIAEGAHPVAVVLTASLGILFISYYLTHGFITKTTIALIGTFLSLTLTGILAVVFGGTTRLTGFGAEEASFLSTQLGHPISVYNLLIAGIIIGALGVLDDITISQASVVAELKHANPKLGLMELFVRGMRVGHDHIASLVNTLVLVYTGSALPLLILFTGAEQSWTSLVNYEPVAEEIVRTLVGSIGLVAAVPITTLIAAYWYSGKR